MATPYVEQIQTLPSNFEVFTAQIAQGLRGLYGETAGAEYESLASERFLETIRHPQVLVLGVREDDEVTALGVGMLRDDIGQIIFMHVLQGHEGQGREHALFCAMVDVLRGNKVQGIVCEFLPMCALDIAAAETEMGFTRVPRLMMQRTLTGNEFTRAAHTRDMQTRDWSAAAEVLVDAYKNHPGRAYHAEVQTADRAKSFITSTLHGGFGKTAPQYNRIAEVDGQIVGIMLGCQAAADRGFVLHVAVREAFQGQGIGEKLMADTLAEFEASGMTGAALGVTETNPARHLYERLQFVTVKKFHTSVWWNTTND